MKAKAPLILILIGVIMILPALVGVGIADGLGLGVVLVLIGIVIGILKFAFAAIEIQTLKHQTVPQQEKGINQPKSRVGIIPLALAFLILIATWVILTAAGLFVEDERSTNLIIFRFIVLGVPISLLLFFLHRMFDASKIDRLNKFWWGYSIVSVIVGAFLLLFLLGILFGCYASCGNGLLFLLFILLVLLVIHTLSFIVFVLKRGALR